MHPTTSRVVLLCLFGVPVGCEPDGGLKVHNDGPQVTIESPGAGAELVEGAQYTFRAQIDDDKGIKKASWFVDGEEVEACRASFEPGEKEATTECGWTATPSATDGAMDIRVVVVDSDSVSTDDTVAVTVTTNEAPVVTCALPEDGARYAIDEVWDIACALSDDRDPSDALEVGVTIDDVEITPLSAGVDDNTYTGQWSIADSGTYSLKVEATDALGRAGFDVVDFAINEGPTDCEITSPWDGETFVPGDAVLVEATADDADDDLDDLVGTLTDASGVVLIAAQSLESEGDWSGTFEVDLGTTSPLTWTVTDPFGADCVTAVDVTICDTLFYQDSDLDGFGDPTSTVFACEAPSGYVADDSDCDDRDPAIHPDATEVCDEVDNDCDTAIDEDVTTTFFADADSDGYGDALATTQACAVPTGYASTDTDCDDTDAAVNPGAVEVCNGIDDDCDSDVDDDDSSVDSATFTTYYADSDSDGFGNASTATAQCDAPSGYITDSADCVDTDPDTFPGAAEYDSATDCMTDADGDGYGSDTPVAAATSGSDCDDASAGIHTLAAETCDGVDDDCDGVIDNGVTTTYYADSDSDGYGDATDPTEDCAVPTGYAASDADCDDTDPAVHPGATEVCNGIDDDCDAQIDDDDSSVDVSTYTTFFADSDGDGYGNAAATTAQCDVPSGYVADDTDCDDTAAGTNPGATEICDSADTDEDCDGFSDDADSSVVGTFTTYYADTDGDGYGDAASTTDTCDLPSGYVADNTDCDDTSAGVNPGATEVCDSSDVDEDCDGLADNADSSVSGVFTTFYADSDGDTYGDAGTTTATCDLPSGYVADATDCDDGDAAVSPAATEVCDSIDNDCDGAVDDADSSVTGVFSTFYADTDGDGYGDPSSTTLTCSVPSGYVADATDCDDSAATTYPGATDAWYDGVDADCAGDSDYDADGDGEDSDTYAGVDCDDADDTINSTAVEVCDGADNDCNGLTDFGICGTWSLDDFPRIDGLAQADFTGQPTVGDVDGDGQDDLFITAYGHGSYSYSTGASLDYGGAFLFYGPVSASTDLSTADWNVYGSGLDGVGLGPVGVADIDDDGYDDFIVGAPYDGADVGELFLYLGSPTQRSGTVASNTTFSSGGYYGRINGTDYRDFLGVHGARPIGDIDNDGIEDLGVWFPYNDDSGNNNNGSALLLLSDNLTLTGGAWNAVGATDVNGQATDGWSGDVRGVGDVDGDGIDDLLIGAQNPTWAASDPLVHFVEGGQALLTAGGFVDIASVYHSQYRNHSGLSLGEGFSPGGGGDIDGDGYSDLVMKDNYAYDTLGNQVGHVYVVLGSASVPANDDIDNIYDLIIEGSPSASGGPTRFGETAEVSPDRDRDGIYEDFDGDGDADLVVGQHDDDDGGVFVYFSGSLQSALAAGTTSLASTADADAILYQPNYGDQARDIAIGDLDGDGSADLIVGGIGYDAGGTLSTGAVWIVQGTLE